MSDPHRGPVGHAFNRAQHRECPTCASFLSTTLTTQANSATEVRWHDRELGDHVCAALRERFDVIREVARGGMGKILLARETSTRRAVAIKVALSDVTTDREQFLREAILTSRFEHPGILPVFDVGVVSGHPYYSMRWSRTHTSLPGG